MDMNRQKLRFRNSKAEKNTLQEACAKLKNSVRTGLRGLRIGKMTALRPGHRYLITENEIERLLSHENGNGNQADKKNQ